MTEDRTRLDTLRRNQRDFERLAERARLRGNLSDMLDFETLARRAETRADRLETLSNLRDLGLL